MKEEMKVLLYYKFVTIQEPEQLAKKHQEFSEQLGIKGKVLIAKEGINGSISGTTTQTETYKEYIRTQQELRDVTFKEENILEHPFTKMITRIKEEIVALKKPVDTTKGGIRLTPKAFLELYEKEKDLIIIDTRNDYEYAVGRFKNAINPKTKTFREFPEFVEHIKEHKNKKVAMYCTGGIRCEKASAYMKEQGFKEVYQLDGGIITYCQTLPNTIWEGKCFVFDKRLITDVEQKGNTISNCYNCNKKTDLYKNCRYPLCDNFVTQCEECQKKLDGCCSENCKKNNIEYFNKKRLQERKTQTTRQLNPV